MADINSNDLGPNNDNNKKQNKSKLPQMPKFNFYWVYGILGIILLGILYMPHDVAIKTTWNDVRTTMLETQDVEKIIVINKERAEVYIKKEALKNDKYKNLKTRGMFSEDSGPHYYFEIGDVNQFSNDLNNAKIDYEKKNVGQTLNIPVEYITQKNYFGDIIGWIFPFVLLIGVWMFFMRRMGGGGSGGGHGGERDYGGGSGGGQSGGKGLADVGKKG